MGNIFRKRHRVSSENSIQNALREKTSASSVINIVIIMALPVVGVLVYSAFHLNQAITLSKEAEEMQQKIALSQDVHHIVNKLQIERGRSASTFGNNSDNSGVLNRYKGAQNVTDGAVRKSAIAESRFQDKIPITLQELKLKITEIREYCVSSQGILESCLKNYTNLIQWMMQFSNKLTVLENEDTSFNSIVIANTALLYGIDAVGLQRALGSLFYLKCDYSTQIQWFLMLRGESETFLKMTFHYDNLAEEAFLSNVGNNTMQINTQKLLREITADTCASTDFEEWLARSLKWFDVITDHMKVLIKIANNQAERIVKVFNDRSTMATEEVLVYVLTLIIGTLVCGSISIWYSWSITKMTKKIKNYAHDLSARSYELKEEKSKTERLLCKMLPPNVAERLKNNLKVPPEHYDNSTVFFSDIVDFTAIGSRSSPYEIVTLLNSLYCLFDNCIDRHDVYKVETIGDAYMVVSGVPIRNGNNHAVEIANLSLSLRSEMGNFIAPHSKYEKIQVRIGVHTGPVVAGIVGTKMPRYCLFGDTVNVASRMESTSKAMMIQISGETFKTLESLGRYDTTLRGVMGIKIPQRTYHYFKWTPLVGSHSSVVKRRATDTRNEHNSNGSNCFLRANFYDSLATLERATGGKGDMSTYWLNGKL